MENNQLVLVVVVNNDCLCAYPIDKEVAKQISTIRQKVQERARAEVYGTLGQPPNVRCQIVNLDMPGCSPDGFITAMINDIMDKVAS